MDLAADPKVFPTLDPIEELAAEWFHVRNPSQEQRGIVMHQLKVELDRQTLFQTMNEKFHPHP